MRSRADTMVIATPWAEDPKAFYYNQKIVGHARPAAASGKALPVHGFRPDDSFGSARLGPRRVDARQHVVLGASPRAGRTGRVEPHGRTRIGFGLNLGYGFGDTSAASENMAFVDGT